MSGGTSVTESHICGLIDAIVLLRYVQVDSAVRRGLTVLKRRGNAHDAAIREFTIGDPFSDARGILGRVLSNR